MNSTGAFFVRWRVRLGYPLAVAVLFFARPQPRSILYGALVGLVGLALRAWAAGYLHKQEVLTVTGPYAYTRNPLYLGSMLIAFGFALASRSIWIAVLLAALFAMIYIPVIQSEEVFLVDHGSLYVALQRLEDRKWIRAKWGVSENNRKARFYSITTKGREQLAEKTGEWRRLTRAMGLILDSGSGPQSEEA